MKIRDKVVLSSASAATASALAVVIMVAATSHSPPEPPSSPAATSTPVPTVTVTSQPKETIPAPCQTALEIASTLDDALNGYQGDLQTTKEIQVKSGEAIYLKDNQILNAATQSLLDLQAKTEDDYVFMFQTQQNLKYWNQKCAEVAR